MRWKVSLVLCTILLGVYGYAQEAQKILNTSKITYNKDKEIIHAYVLVNSENKISINDTLYYAWFKSGKINYSQGIFYGRLLHGSYACFYSETNTIKEYGDYIFGLKNGPWKTWSIDGRLRSVVNYKSGILDGNSTYYGDTGNNTRILKYRRGVLITQKNNNKKLKIKTKHNDTQLKDSLVINVK